MKRLTRNLLDRSEQAFMLALEIFNKPTIHYRIEGFCFFYTNAWELLAKARIVHTSGKESTIYYPKKRKQPRRSLSLRDAIERVIPNDKDPVRRNIEVVEELRDHATHLLIPELEAIYSGIFQASALNYVNFMRNWFGRDIGGKTTTPLLSLVWDLKDLQPEIIRKRHGNSLLWFLQEQRAQIQDLEKEMGDRQFSISIEYKLVLTKRPSQADITLGAGPGGAIAGQIVEVPKDFSGWYTQNTAIPEIQKRLKTTMTFTRYDFQAVIRKEKIKRADSSAFHYRIPQTGSHLYSPKLVELIVEKMNADPDCLNRARESYSRHLQNRKKRLGARKRK